jgi:hypothetical protein
MSIMPCYHPTFTKRRQPPAVRECTREVATPRWHLLGRLNLTLPFGGTLLVTIQHCRFQIARLADRNDSS